MGTIVVIFLLLIFGLIVSAYDNNYASEFTPSLSATLPPLSSQAPSTFAPTFISSATFPTVEYDALRDFYFTANGMNWVWGVTNQVNVVPWNFTTVGGMQANPCVERWEGVYCSCTSQALSLCTTTGLILHYHNMSGNIASSIGNLTNLHEINLSNNNLVGTLPTTIGSLKSLQVLTIVNNSINSTIPLSYAALTNLTIFLLTDNDIEGTIPLFISSYSNLLQLGLAENYLHGTIPGSLSALSNLQEFSLSGNYFEGSIAECLVTSFANLTDFNVARNFLTGSLPHFTPQFTPSLKKLSLQVNSFTGTLPIEFGLFKNLTTLQVNNNLLSGELPTTMQYLTNLESFSCANNSMNGTIDVLFTNNTSILNVIVEFNFFTGNAFPYGGNYFNFTTTYEAYSNLLEGTIPRENVGFQYITYLDIGLNFIESTIPYWVCNITFLDYFYVDKNYLTGTIPKGMGYHGRQLQILYLEDNMLSGTIPMSLTELKSLKELKLQSNQLTGSIPHELIYLPVLSLFMAYSNNLVGPLPPFFAPSMLEVVDVASNHLTGTIPFSMFMIDSLESVILADNCFHGTLNDEICYADNLINLVLDGMGTATGCQRKLFPGLPFLTSFAEERNSYGTLPSCIWSMTNLAALYLSANEIIGTLPSLATITPNLRYLSLAGNLLTGTLPLWIQQGDWVFLDLSNNKLTGTLSSSITPLQSDGYLALDVNRLSGHVPAVLMSAQNLTILTGNIYTCTPGKNDIPHHDSDRDRYSCGSQAVDVSIIFWMGCICVFIATWIWAYHWLSQSFLLDSRGMSNNTNGPMTASGISRSSMSVKSHVIRASQYIQSVIYEARRDWTTISKERNIRKSNPIRRMIFFLSAVRYVFTGVFLVVLVVLMPLYGILSIFYSTYYYSYAWSISAILLSGHVPGALVLIGFALTTILVLFLFMKKVYPFSARLQQDKLDSFDPLIRPSDSSQVSDIMNSVRVSSFAMTEVMRQQSFKPSIDPRQSSQPVYNVKASTLSEPSTSTITSSEIIPRYMQSGASFSMQDREYSSQYSVGSSIVAVNKKEWYVYRCATFILGFLNFVVMIFVDVGYVILILEANTQQIISVQIILSILKVQWNEYVLWQLYPRIRIGFTLLFKRFGFSSALQQDILRTVSEDGNKGLWQLFRQKVSQYQFTTDEINFMAFTVIFNNVFIPCVAIAIVSPHCFYNAFFAEQPSETITIYSCEFYRLRQHATKFSQDCLRYTSYDYTSSYNTPFQYRYECSAAFSIKFVSVYIFMFVLVGAVMPMFNVMLIRLYHIFEPSESAKNESTWWRRWIFQFSDIGLSRRWKPLTPKPPMDVNHFKILANDRLLVRFSSYLAILLAFGVLFPPLALVAVISIYSITYIEQFSISRLLVESKALNYVWYQEKILKECEYIAESWFDTLKIILPFASFSYAFVVFDTLGDQYGWKVAVGPALLVIVLPWCFYIWKRLKFRKETIMDDVNSDFLYEDIFISLKEGVKSMVYGNMNNKMNRNSMETRDDSIETTNIEMRLSSVISNLYDNHQSTFVKNPINQRK